MQGSGHTNINFDGIIKWADFKKAIILAGRGIPDDACITFETNGSSKPELREQTIRADWDLNDLNNETGRS